MEVIYFNEFIEKYKDVKICACIGEFDGVHKAHQQLITLTKNLSSKKHTKSAVIFFEPHPYLVLNNKVENFELTDFDTKIDIISFFKIDYVIVIKFTKSFAELSSENFIKEYLDHLSVDTLIVGYDFTFGKDGRGSSKDILNLSKFNVEIFNEVKFNDQKLSSTSIRKDLDNQNILEANEQLGYNYSIVGRVVEGFKLGRTIGYPTANLDVSPSTKIPGDGLYGVKVYTRKRSYKGLCNIGMNPTFNRDKRTIETHLINFKGNLYGEHIMIEFMYFIRPEKKFSTTDELVLDIKKCIKEVKKNIR